MTKTLYVGNLAPETSADRLRELFSAHGREVASVTLVTDSKTGQPRGFGFVEMASEDDASAALIAMRGTNVDSRVLLLGEAGSAGGAGANQPGVPDDGGVERPGASGEHGPQ